MERGGAFWAFVWLPGLTIVMLLLAAFCLTVGLLVDLASLATQSAFAATERRYNYAVWAAGGRRI